VTTPARLKRACIALSLADPALARAYAALGVPAWRSGAAEYATLGRMISGQQVSTRAAAAIWGRTEAFLGEVTPARVLAVAPESLQACGLSRPKVAHLRAIAEAMETGALDLARVCAADPVAARAELLAVRGIGPWTAELFLLYAARAMDAFPVGDVALMEGHRQLSDAENRMNIKDFTRYAEIWRPYRGVAAHLLWGWINAGRAPADRA
jgi:DNA-3-methyladenine glycosylase II